MWQQKNKEKCMNFGNVAAHQASFICESKSEMTLDVIILQTKQADQIFAGTARLVRYCKMHFNDTATFCH